MNKKILVISICAILLISAAVSGIYLLKIKNRQSVPDSDPSPVPAVTQGKNGSNFEIGREAVPKTTEKVPEKTGVKVPPKSTKQIFDSVPKQVQGRLVKIILKKMPLGENKTLTNTLIFVFYDDAAKKTTETDYVLASGKFLKNPDSGSVPASSETVPESVIEIGYEGMMKMLLADDEYKNYRTKYPQLFSNCSNTLVKNSQFGWEWITACSSSVNGKISYIAFATNLETKKTTVIKSENLE